MSSVGSYEPAPPAPRADPAGLVNGRPMSRPHRSYWPDRNPLPSGRATLGQFAAAASMFVVPFAVDGLGGPPWRTLWVMFAFGIAFLVQAGMDTARPRPDDRVGVWNYRLTYLLLPVLIAGLVLLLGDPFATG